MKNQLPNQVNYFLDYLKDVKGKSQNTINGYEIDLKLFFRWYKLKNNLIKDVKFNNIEISDITDSQIKIIKLQDLHGFISYVKNVRQNSNKSICRKVATLKSFFSYLKKVKIIEEDISLELENPKVQEKDPVYLTLEECQSLLSAVRDGSFNSQRNYCILLILVNHGLRVSELNHLKIQDINFNTKEINILGKGNKYRKVYMNNITENALTKYINNATLEDNVLFNISKEQINNIIKKYCIKAGVNKPITAHKLRHTNATLTYKQTHNIRLVQENLGHESVKTTQIYAHICDEDRKRYANQIQIG